MERRREASWAAEVHITEKKNMFSKTGIHIKKSNLPEKQRSMACFQRCKRSVDVGMRWS
jgi:hypothetical protein